MKTSAERWNGFRYSQKRRGKEPLGLNGGWDGPEERSYHVVWRGFLTHYRKIKITSEKVSSTAFKTCQSHSYLSSWHVFMCVCGSSAQRWFPRVRSYFKVIYEKHFPADLLCHPLGFVVINKHVYLYQVKMYSASRLTWTCAVRLVWGVCAGAGFLSLWGKDTNINKTKKTWVTQKQYIKKKPQGWGLSSHNSNTQSNYKRQVSLSDVYLVESTGATAKIR